VNDPGRCPDGAVPELDDGLTPARDWTTRGHRSGALPDEYKAVIEAAAKQANVDMMSRCDARKPPALQSIIDNSDVILLPVPDERHASR